ncbi:diguanylate cyclase [Enterobacteriaceae bacterium RIT693]|nr:diguanylate cyclase [Enterobacteriaceae bacterium RIT693]
MLDTAMTDELTGLLNRQGFMFLGQYATRGADRRAEHLSVAYVVFEHFGHINDSFGHEQGDRALVVFSELMNSSFRETDLIARQSVDEFILLFNGSSEEGAFIAMQHLDGKVAAFNQRAENPWTLAFNWGCVEYDVSRHSCLDDVVAEVDQAMHQARTLRTERA